MGATSTTGRALETEAACHCIEAGEVTPALDAATCQCVEAEEGTPALDTRRWPGEMSTTCPLRGALEAALATPSVATARAPESSMTTVI
jgi:hypothetical protein